MYGGSFAAPARAFQVSGWGACQHAPPLSRLLFWFTLFFYFSWVFRYGVHCRGWAAPRARAQPAPHRLHGLRGVVYTYRPCSLFSARVGGAWLAETPMYEAYSCVLCLRVAPRSPESVAGAPGHWRAASPNHRTNVAASMAAPQAPLACLAPCCLVSRAAAVVPGILCRDVSHFTMYA